MPNTVSSVDISQAGANSPALANNFSIAGLIQTIFSIVVPLAGAILLLLLLYGGFTYLTAAGNDEQVAKAKKIITQAIIGIIIVSFSFGIGLWVINSLGINSTTGPVTQIAQNTNQVGAANVNVVLTPNNGGHIATGVYNSISITEPNTQIAQSITGNSVPSQGGTVIYGDSVDSTNNTNSGLKGNTTNGTYYDSSGNSITGNSTTGSGTSITGNSVTGSGGVQNSVNNPNGQTIGDGGAIGNTYSTNNPGGGITETNAVKPKSCAWYKKILNYVGLANCTSTPNSDQTVINNGGTTSDGVLTNDGKTTASPVPVSISSGQTVPVMTGYTYDVVVTTKNNIVCTATNKLTNDTVISATAEANGSCKVEFLNGFKPGVGAVTINTLDANTNKPLNGVAINVQGQTAATGKSAGDASTQYLKGSTSGNGTTTFNIDQPGSRMTTASLNGYISCNKNLLLSAGNAIVIYMDKVTNNTSSCRTETFLLAIPQTNTSQDSSTGMPAGKTNPSLPQPANRTMDVDTPLGKFNVNVPPPPTITGNSVPGSSPITGNSVPGSAPINFNPNL